MSAENGDVIITQNPTDMLEQARNYLQRVQLALQESTDFEEILDIRDRGELFRQYSRQQRHGIEIQNAGAEIKIRAERRMGELLREMKEGGELQHGGDRRSESRFHRNHSDGREQLRSQILYLRRAFARRRNVRKKSPRMLSSPSSTPG
jgi:hypothetical protein